MTGIAAGCRRYLTVGGINQCHTLAHLPEREASFLMIHFLREALEDSQLVQSFSGVRTVFGLGPEISPSLQALAGAYAYCYAVQLPHKGEVTLLLGRDPRPYGQVCGSSPQSRLCGRSPKSRVSVDVDRSGNHYNTFGRDGRQGSGSRRRSDHYSQPQSH